MVYFLFTLSFFFFWSCFGSFVWVLMEANIKRSFWTGRSQCLACRKNLRWYELIPVVSYFLQNGRCRQCDIRIPTWILSVESMMGIVWMFFGTLFTVHGYDTWVIMTHLLFLSMLLILAIEDIRSFTIPDRLSLPMIFITLAVILLLQTPVWFLPGWKLSLLGGFIGMSFYLLQMILPGISHLVSRRKYSDIFQIIFTPLFFPFWMILKISLWEKKADTVIPSISLLENLPGWVGGGDVRLWFLIGLIVWPIYFWWIIGIGYALWTLFWATSWVLWKRKIDILPVAPLLFLGFCLTWLVLFFS